MLTADEARKISVENRKTSEKWNFLDTLQLAYIEWRIKSQSRRGKDNVWFELIEITPRVEAKLEEAGYRFKDISDGYWLSW